MDIVEMAKLSLKQPSDSWFGNDLLWNTHGMSGWNQHRDSSLIERANFNFVVDQLAENFGSEDTDGLWWINHASHWAVGWVDQIMVKVVNDPEQSIDEDNLTDIFSFCMELIDSSMDYVVLSDAYYESLKEQELISEVQGNFPGWADPGLDPVDVINYAYSYDLYISDGEDQWMISPPFVEAVTFVTGSFDPEDLDEVTVAIESIIDIDSVTYYDEHISAAQDLIENFFKLLDDNKPKLFS